MERRKSLQAAPRIIRIIARRPGRHAACKKDRRRPAGQDTRLPLNIKFFMLPSATNNCCGALSPPVRPPRGAKPFALRSGAIRPSRSGSRSRSSYALPPFTPMGVF